MGELKRLIESPRSNDYMHDPSDWIRLHKDTLQFYINKMCAEFPSFEQIELTGNYEIDVRRFEHKNIEREKWYNKWLGEPA